MPVIAIAPCSRLPDYVAAVRRAGGDPRVLDRDRDAPDQVIAGVSGLLLAGGGDVDPALYGEAPHHSYDASEPGRDRYEIALVDRALAADIPVFAICRGVQLLNVARGGTLIQDIPSAVAQAVEHQLSVPPNEPYSLAHDITIERESLLARVLGGRAGSGAPIDVNSRHHQALKRPGEALVVTAMAADGVIEAVEDPGRRFLLGVQWHPENFWRTGEFAALFDAFIRASAGENP